MPFISDLSKVDLERVLKKFGFHKLVSFREFPFGIESVNIKVKTESGVFVLKQWADVKQKNIAFELSVMKELREKGFPVPEAFKALNGKQVAEFGGKRFSLFEFMYGRYVKNSKLNKKQLVEIGRTLAEMQLALKGFKPKGESNRKDLVHFDIDHYIIKNAFLTIDKKSLVLLKELEEEVEALEPKIKRFRKRLCEGPVHDDFFGWNIKFRGNKINAILDFGDSCVGAWASDLATMLMHTAQIKNGMSSRRIKLIMQGYEQKIKLNKIEVEALPYLMLHRAIHIPLSEISAILRQPKNKTLYLRWIRKDWKTVKLIKRQIPKIKKTLH